MDIQLLSAGQIRQHLHELVALLQDAVDHGASIGFYPPPLSAAEASDYWQSVVAGVEAGSRHVIAALVDGHVAGCVQLALEMRRNQLHRAEVQKLMVHTTYRKRGIGQALIAEVDAVARAAGRSLLVLDVVEGADAERLYQRQGYVRAGAIPHYAISADGVLEATVLYYRELG